MSVKLADTLAPMSNFPVAEAKDIDININGTHKMLQTAYEDGDLGGGGSSIQVDQMPAASAENLGKVLQFIGDTGTYTKNYFYACVSDGETPPAYSWVQVNVQPSNALASQVAYDNTTSELAADDVQEAIDEVVAGLGTAAGKDYTDTVRPNSHDLVESGSVYSAINNALSAIYTPRGSLSCTELTSSLLVEANVGNVYEMSDSGTTSALFINGAGKTISVGDNVGIIKAGADSYMFNYMGDAFDLTDYAKKPSSSTANNLASLDANGNLVDSGATIKNGGTKVLALKGYSTTDAVDLNTLKSTGVYSVTSQLASNLPDSSFLAWWQIIVINKSTTSSGYCSQIAMARNNSIYMRDCENDTWTAWKQIVTDVVKDVAVTRTGAASNSGVFVKQYGNIVQINFAALVSVGGSDTPTGTSLYTGFPKPALTTVRFSLSKAENKDDTGALLQIDANGTLKADGQGLSYGKAFWGSYTYLTY